MGKIIMITSGKGGVGKTTLCAALGGVLSASSHKVLLVDGDLGLRDLDLALGVQDEVFYTSSDVWNKECLPKDAIVQINEKLDFLPASQIDRWEDIKRKKLGKVIKKQSKNYDFILVDSPAGIGRGMESLVDFVDEFCVVVEPNWMALRDAGRVIQFLREREIRNFHIVLNKNEMDSKLALIDPYDVAEAVGVDYLAAIIPYGKEILAAGNEGQLVEHFTAKNNAHILKTLVDSIVNDEVYEIENILALLATTKIINEDDLEKEEVLAEETELKEENLQKEPQEEVSIAIKEDSISEIKEDEIVEEKDETIEQDKKEPSAPSIARRICSSMWKWGRRGRR